MHRRTAIALLVSVGLLLAGTTAPRPAAALSCGPCPATATDDLNLRAGPSLSADILRVIPAGAGLEWDPFADRIDGFVVVAYDGIDGWAAAAYLLLFPTSATTTARLNLRADPGLSADVVEVMPDGAVVQVLAGPDNGFFAVRYEQRVAGWAHGDYLDLGSGPGDFAAGEAVVVATDALNLRGGPGLGEEVEDLLFQGDRLVVLAGPEGADGYAWYEVDAGGVGTGWVAGAYLAAA